MLHRTVVAALPAAFALTAPVRAAEICACIVESNPSGDVRNLDLWLKSDLNIDLLYQVGGRDIVSAVAESNASANGSYALHAGAAASKWSHSAPFGRPGQIDIAVTILAVPTDVYAGVPPTPLASFAFDRDMASAERILPPTLARTQCMETLNGE